MRAASQEVTMAPRALAETQRSARGGLAGAARGALSLAKVRITGLAAATTLLGYASIAGRLDLSALTAAVGTFLVAAASAVFNHVQEADLDRRMRRTRRRPVASGGLGRAPASLIGIALAGLGLSLLSTLPEHPVLALLLALAAMALYNLVYTPLKRRTVFAPLPGALIGAIPPVIGVVAAGGSLRHPVSWLLGGFFFVWQVPHFFLLQMRHEADYERAGFPTLRRALGQAGAGRAVFSWATATLLLGPAVALFGPWPAAAAVVLLAASVLLAVRLRWLLVPEWDGASLRPAFRDLNLFALLFLVTLGLGALVG
jgi:protoheme IX farnesyltransferase